MSKIPSVYSADNKRLALGDMVFAVIDIAEDNQHEIMVIYAGRLHAFAEAEPLPGLVAAKPSPQLTANGGIEWICLVGYDEKTDNAFLYKGRREGKNNIGFVPVFADCVYASLEAAEAAIGPELPKAPLLPKFILSKLDA